MAVIEILYRLSDFREDFFLEIDQPETRIAYDAMFVNGLEHNKQSLQRIFHPYMLPTKFQFIWPSSFREED